ncbi:MAG: hypothetical protein ATN35_03535 [Epulopiscium sp. Nele67-Bin004]|nr:MAG: hypothetical protein ATN35_03535 [Epulopiscium sp. Nele67-Bin004]
MNNNINKLLDEVNAQLEQNLDENISQERIKELAMKGIKTQNKSKVINFPKRTLPMAAAFTLFSTATFAAGLSYYSQNLFGDDYEIVEEHIARIGQSVEFDGVRVTLEEVLAVDKEAVIIISTTNVDGTAMDEGAFYMDSISIIATDANGNRAFSSGHSMASKLSEDNLKLITTIQYDLDESLENMTLSISVGDLFADKEIVAPAQNIDLRGMYESSKQWGYIENPNNINLQEIFGASLSQTFSDVLPEGVNIARVQYKEGTDFTLFFEGYEAMDGTRMLLVLNDSVTGKSYTPNLSSSNYTEKGKIGEISFFEEADEIMANLDNMTVEIQMSSLIKLAEGSADFTVDINDIELPTVSAEVNTFIP